MNDPVDHARTTRPHAGESLKDGQNAPGLLALAVAVIVLVVSLYFFATGQPAIGGTTLIIAVTLGFVGGWWLSMTHRRARDREMEYLDAHPDVPRTPPTS